MTCYSILGSIVLKNISFGQLKTSTFIEMNSKWISFFTHLLYPQISLQSSPFVIAPIVLPHVWQMPVFHSICPGVREPGAFVCAILCARECVFVLLDVYILFATNLLCLLFAFCVCVCDCFSFVYYSWYWNTFYCHVLRLLKKMLLFCLCGINAERKNNACP